MTARRPAWRRGAGLTAKLLVSAALLLYLARRVDFAYLGREIAGADPRTLAVAALILCMSNVVGAIQWRTLLGAVGLQLSVSRVFVYYLQGLFFGLFLPASVGADVSRVYDTTRHTGELGGSVAATVMDRLVGFYSMSTMAIVALAIAPSQLPPPAILVPILGFAVVNLMVCLALFSRRASRLLVRLAAGLPERRFRAGVVALVHALHALGRRPRLLLLVFGLSVLVQVMRILTHYEVSRSMGIDLAPREFFVIIPILAVLVALPISFGGIGVRESAAVRLFAHSGLSAPQAIGMQLIAFMIAIVVNLPGWMVFVARQLRARGGAAATPIAARPMEDGDDAHPLGA